MKTDQFLVKNTFVYHFIPENVLEDKKLYTLYKFMKSQGSVNDLEYEKFKEDYKYYSEDNEEEIQEEFDVL